jgi:hypothetical protein
MTLKIDARALATETLRYESPSATGGGVDHVALGESGGVTGFYAFEDVKHVVDATAERFMVTSASYQVGTGARVTVTQESRLDGVKLRLDIPAGEGATTMHLELGTAALAGASYVDADVNVGGNATLERAVVDLDRDGKLVVTAPTLRAKGVVVKTGDVTIALADVTVEGLSVENLGARTLLAATRITASGITIEAGDAPITIARATATGFRWDDRIEVDQLDVVEATFSVGLLPSPGAAPAPSAASPTTLPDLPALDALRGVVATQVKLGIDLPILPDKTIARSLSIPIEGGSISFGELEKSLCVLDDALFDFEVEDDVLLLELDVVPVVKFDNVTLVTWTLPEARDRELAKGKRVRLRRLVQYRLPPGKPAPPAPSAPKKKLFRLLGIDFAGIDVALGLEAPATIAAAGGTITLGAATKLAVQGEVHVAVDGAPAPGRLDATLAGSAITLADVTLGPVKVVRATLQVAVDDARLELVDVTPQRFGATVREAKVTGLSLEA